MKPAPAALLLAVALGGLATGYLLYRHAAPPQPTARVAAARTDAEEIPAQGVPEAGPPALPIPATVPAIVLEDLAGRQRALRDGSGRPHLYNFWATWCEPCRREIPLLNTLQGAYHADGLEIVGIAVDFREAVQQFLKTRRLNYGLLIGEEGGLEAAQKLGMEMNLPFSVFADGEDRIIAVKVGELHRPEADAILLNMRALKAGRISLDQARTAIASSLKTLAMERAKQSVPSPGTLSRP